MADKPRKPIHLTHHDAGAVAERDLSMAWVEAAAYEPDWRMPDPRRPGVERRFRVIPDYGSRVLRAACFETDSEIRILTVFFDRKARPPE